MVINGHHPFPHLPTKSLNVILLLRREGECCFGLVPIPKSLPLFYRLEEPRPAVSAHRAGGAGVLRPAV